MKYELVKFIEDIKEEINKSSIKRSSAMNKEYDININDFTEVPFILGNKKEEARQAIKRKYIIEIGISLLVFSVINILTKLSIGFTVVIGCVLLGIITIVFLNELGKFDKQQYEKCLKCNSNMIERKNHNTEDYTVYFCNYCKTYFRIYHWYEKRNTN